jgi:site-specific DNA recombinase
MDIKQQKVALYARVSSQEQATEGVSIEAQVATLSAYAKSQGWDVADEYIDGGYSGGTDERPALKRLIVDAGQRRFSIIAVSKLDRFFRNLRLLLNHLYGLEQLGIKFVSAQEGLDTSTPYGKFAVQMMGVIAEFERDRIGERVKDSRQYLITQGNWPGGRTVYGYRWLAKEQKWEVNEKEAEVVRYIYHLYLNEGLGTMKIPFRLNEESYRTRLGYLWGIDAIHRVLTHPGYKGLHPRGLKMPAIVDEVTWEMAQEKRLKARHVRRSVRHWLLQGLCVCGECGHVLGCIQKDQTERRYYSCPGRWKDCHLDKSPKCTLPRMRADLLEKAVWRRLKAVLTDSEALKDSLRNTLTELKQKRNELNKGSGSIDRELETISGKKERLGLAYADGAVGKEAYDDRLRILKKKEGELLKARSNLDPQVGIDLDALQQGIVSLEKALDGKSGRLLLTELGIWAESVPEDWIAGHVVLPHGAWDEPGALEGLDVIRIGDTGPIIRMVDSPGVFCNLEVPREIVWQNIRNVLEWLCIRVYVFHDRVEMRGFIPTEVMDIDRGTDHIRREAITCSARGVRREGAKPPLKTLPPPCQEG